MIRFCVIKEKESKGGEKARGAGVLHDVSSLLVARREPIASTVAIFATDSVHSFPTGDGSTERRRRVRLFY